MSNTILNISNDLEKYRDNIDFNDFEAESAQSFILTKLNEIEKEYNIVKSKVDPIVNNIDKLKKDENNLYETIKRKYQDKSDEDIVSEISRFLEK
jgi:predicted transcriptional regulator